MHGNTCDVKGQFRREQSTKGTEAPQLLIANLPVYFRASPLSSFFLYSLHPFAPETRTASPPLTRSCLLSVAIHVDSRSLTSLSSKSSPGPDPGRAVVDLRGSTCGVTLSASHARMPGTTQTRSPKNPLSMIFPNAHGIWFHLHQHGRLRRQSAAGATHLVTGALLPIHRQ